MLSSSPKQVHSDPQWVPYRENGEVKYMRADEANDFNATGGQFTYRRPSAWSNFPGSLMASAPNLLPEKYTDDSIIAVVVTDVVTPCSTSPPAKQGIMNKLFKSDKSSLRTTKAVWMPRREYKRYFAKDNEGNYIGTEPHRDWTVEELDDAFRQYAKCT